MQASDKSEGEVLLPLPELQEWLSNRGSQVPSNKVDEESCGMLHKDALRVVKADDPIINPLEDEEKGRDVDTLLQAHKVRCLFRLDPIDSAQTCNMLIQNHLCVLIGLKNQSKQICLLRFLLKAQSQISVPAERISNIIFLIQSAAY